MVFSRQTFLLVPVVDFLLFAKIFQFHGLVLDEDISFFSVVCPRRKDSASTQVDMYQSLATQRIFVASLDRSCSIFPTQFFSITESDQCQSSVTWSYMCHSSVSVSITVGIEHHDDVLIVPPTCALEQVQVSCAPTAY